MAAGAISRALARGGVRTRVALAFLAPALFLAGYYLGNLYQRPAAIETVAAIRLRPSLPLPAFALEDSTGAPVTAKRLAGRWTLLLLGTLDDPATREALALFNRVHNALADRPEILAQVRFAFVTLDPRRDGAEALAAAVAAYNPELLAAGGDSSALAEALGVTREAAPPATLFLVSPGGRIPALFTGDQDPATIAADIKQFHAAGEPAPDGPTDPKQPPHG